MNKYTVQPIAGGFRVLNPRGEKVWDFTGYFCKRDADAMAAEQNEIHGLDVTPVTLAIGAL